MHIRTYYSHIRKHINTHAKHMHTCTHRMHTHAVTHSLTHSLTTQIGGQNADHEVETILGQSPDRNGASGPGDGGVKCVRTNGSVVCVLICA